MTGSFKQKFGKDGKPMIRNGKPVWRLIVTYGYIIENGRRRQQQSWSTFDGTKREMQDHLGELVGKVRKQEFVAPSRTTLIEYLREWLKLCVIPHNRRATANSYGSVIRNHIDGTEIAFLPLQKLRTSHLEAFYATPGLTIPTAKLCHQVLHRALKRAVRDRLIMVNPASAVEHKPRPKYDPAGVRANCWSGVELVKFLRAAADAGTQLASLFTLACDSGARRSELLGLKWSDIDLDAARVRIERQLLTGGEAPVFGPTKSGRERTITISPETVVRLREHRARQRELMMANRMVYVDNGLVFAMETAEAVTQKDRVGHPLRQSWLDRQFKRLIAAAAVPAITVHGLRHSCATALLTSGIAVHVVSQRLGHADPSITLSTYAHTLPDAQQAAADAIRAVLHGR